jgi:uncharacterized membrane protein YuzA (DUF378 family)
MKKNMIETIALTLVIIGAVNWGLVGAFHTNLVTLLLGSIPVRGLTRAIYVLIGLSGLYSLTTLYKMVK